jgi:hypothetical protein
MSRVRQMRAAPNVCAKMGVCAKGAHAHFWVGAPNVCAKKMRQKCAFGAHGGRSVCAKMRQGCTGPVCAKCTKYVRPQKALAQTINGARDNARAGPLVRSILPSPAVGTGAHQDNGECTAWGWERKDRQGPLLRRKDRNPLLLDCQSRTMMLWSRLRSSASGRPNCDCVSIIWLPL